MLEDEAKLSSHSIAMLELPLPVDLAVAVAVVVVVVDCVGALLGK